jgi:hypothetical protein
MSLRSSKGQAAPGSRDLWELRLSPYFRAVPAAIC